MTEADIQACAGTVFKADPDRFAAVMAAPVAMRDVLFPIHAMSIEVGRAPWATEEPMIAEMRVQWWRDALSEIAEGKTARRHEVVTPLSEILSPETAAMLDGFVEVRRWDIYKEPFEDEAHFRDYLVQSSGGLYRALCASLSESDAACDEFGFAVGLANYLKAVPELKDRGRIPLVDGRPEAVRALAEDGLASLKQSRLAKPSRASRYAFLPGWQAERTLRAIAANPNRVAASNLEFSDFSKKASLMWKAFTGRI